IDNDLGATDQTFGFDTAIQIATDALDRIRDTADSHDRVMLVEVMGRNAGWIALHAGIAGGADAILLPEIPYRAQVVAEMIQRRRSAGKNYSVIVVAEGATPYGGEVSQLEARLGEMPRLMGAAHRVAAQLDDYLHEASMRVTVLGHIQRGGSPTTFDRVLATRYGVMAAQLVHEEQFGKMVALRNGEIVAVDLKEAVTAPKLVDPSSQIVSQAREIGICFGE
ncbi:MAG: 6-phosphofructokinase, partial [Myxococcales bacterium]|nr:6-phosphofructokinase [Myxococcales bacterium]